MELAKPSGGKSGRFTGLFGGSLKEVSCWHTGREVGVLGQEGGPIAFQLDLEKAGESMKVTMTSRGKEIIQMEMDRRQSRNLCSLSLVG